ncbi:MAG: hypothetical protein M1606_00375 [Candidatus Thermoplasmatota archaeon]|nr:hypothetical protein [Candidatus Thermoplasmatota archaeon]MCL5983110.1 hypothetical protein [Candidatus Thermoplasmatota archaeon]
MILRRRPLGGVARAGWWGFAATTAVLVALGLLSRSPGPYVGFAVAVAASAGALAIRLIATEQRGSVLFLLPLIGAWAYLGLAAPITLLTEILAALAALSGLVWMAERSTAGSSGLRRAADVLPLPAVGVAIALVAGLLIPPGELRVGIAALLLVAALALVAIVLAHLHPARERVASIL